MMPPFAPPECARTTKTPPPHVEIALGKRGGCARHAPSLDRWATLLSMSRPAALALGLIVAACAPRAPSSPEARVSTPTSVTMTNPAGDAKEPEDAALSRLLAQPASERTDRWTTLGVALPDAGNWRRVRIYGHPTRATFRYGDEHFAIDTIEYRAAEGDDSPEACLQRFADDARDLAERHGVTFGPVVPGFGQHPRGVEAIDWAAERRRVDSPVPIPNGSPPPSSAPSSSAPPLAESPGSSATTTPSAPPVVTLTDARSVLRLPASAVMRIAKSLPAPALLGRRGSPLGLASMPSLRSSADMVTFFRRHRYVGAVAAFRSWPGTCLLRAVAVKVGTDEPLAERVVDRWLAELAPRTRWSSRLRRAPRVEDR